MCIMCELCFVCLYKRWRCHIPSQPACMSCVCQAASHLMHAGTTKTPHQMHERCVCCKPSILAPGAPASECCTALSIWAHEMRTVVDVQYPGGAMNLDTVHSATLTGCLFSRNSAKVPLCFLCQQCVRAVFRVFIQALEVSHTHELCLSSRIACDACWYN